MGIVRQRLAKNNTNPDCNAGEPAEPSSGAKDASTMAIRRQRVIHPWKLTCRKSRTCQGLGCGATACDARRQELPLPLTQEDPSDTSG